MREIEIAFLKPTTKMDRFIAFMTKSKYSHVEFFLNKRSARIGSHASFDGCFVRHVQPNIKLWHIVKVSANDAMIERIYRHGRSGCKYNYIGAMLSIFRSKKKFSNSMFCSEFVAKCLGFANPSKYTPQDILERVKDGSTFEVI